jgi:H+/Cl- antiporter ClcA
MYSAFLLSEHFTHFADPNLSRADLKKSYLFVMQVNRRYLQGKEPKSGKLYHILDNPSGAPMIILASAAAAYLTRAGCWLGGTHPLKLTEYTLGAKFNSFQEFLAFGTVGLFAGFGALLYQKMCEVISKSLKKLPSKNIAPLFGGAVCTGLAFLGRPQNLPTGYKALNDVFNGKITGFRPLATIVTERLVSLASCSASGVIGGAFAPCMFIGSALGALVHAGRANLLRALAFSEILISGTSSMSVYAAVGTAAFVSSMQRSPITGAICIMELTNNFSLMLPTLIGSTIATYIVGKFQKSD